MIVRNEVHIVEEVLNVAASHISSWVIVDTGSDDGTQDLIRNHMARLGIPGTLYERPWRNFGANRTEAVALAQGHGDYIWVMDADDTVAGTLDFAELSADIYFMRLEENSHIYWYPQLFRDGVKVQYVGVTHESPTWDDSCVVSRIEGDYCIPDRHLGTRSVDPQKYAWDRDLLLAEVERDPNDGRSVFFLAQSYFNLGDFANARKWYARRVEMGGNYTEQVYYAMYQVAQAMSHLGEPWPDVQDAYLRAWEFRPTRAEPLYALAWRYRQEQRYQLGYLYARRAAEIPFPEHDLILVRHDIHTWRATDEQAVCASWTGRHPEAFALWRRVLAQSGIPDDDRQRIASNRDVCVPTMLEAACAYPDAQIRALINNSGDADIVVSLVAGPDLASTEQTLNSFVNCCTDVARVGRFLVLDGGLSAQDRAELVQHYGFLEFVSPPSTPLSPPAALPYLRTQIHERFWLHLGEGWRFFAPEDVITRLTAVLQAEQQVFQVGINFTDAVKLTGTSAAEDTVRRAPDAGRYVLTNTVAHGPAMLHTARLDQAGGMTTTGPDFVVTLEQRAAATGLRTASLDEVLCIAAPS